MSDWTTTVAGSQSLFGLVVHVLLLEMLANSTLSYYI